jgi:hypothetical protein
VRGTTQEQKEIKIPFESLDPLRSVLKKPEELSSHLACFPSSKVAEVTETSHNAGGVHDLKKKTPNEKRTCDNYT